MSEPLFGLVDGFQANDFEFLDPSWRLDFYFVAYVAPEKRLSNGRGCRDQTLRDVGFLGADQLILDLDGFLDVQHPYARPVAGPVGWNIIEVQHADVAQPLFQLAEARRNVALALLRI